MLAAKYLDQIPGKGASCGTAVLGLITSGDYSKTRGEEVDKCGFYKPDFESTKTKGPEFEEI